VLTWEPLGYKKNQKKGSKGGGQKKDKKKMLHPQKPIQGPQRGEGGKLQKEVLGKTREKRGLPPYWGGGLEKTFGERVVVKKKSSTGPRNKVELNVGQAGSTYYK